MHDIQSKGQSGGTKEPTRPSHPLTRKTVCGWSWGFSSSSCIIIWIEHYWSTNEQISHHTVFECELTLKGWRANCCVLHLNVHLHSRMIQLSWGFLFFSLRSHHVRRKHWGNITVFTHVIVQSSKHWCHNCRADFALSCIQLSIQLSIKCGFNNFN